jgi:hypothetical protein
MPLLTDMQIKMLKARGYAFRGVRKLPNGEFVAEATKDIYLAAHLGESPRISVRNLIKLVTRR